MKRLIPLMLALALASPLAPLIPSRAQQPLSTTRTLPGPATPDNSLQQRYLDYRTGKVDINTLSPQEQRQIFSLARLINLGACAQPVQSRINGTFTGWNGVTQIPLMNGQVWQQSSGGTLQANTFNPAASVERRGSCCMLQVEGFSDNICVEQVR